MSARAIKSGKPDSTVIKEELERLDQVLENQQELLVIIHNNPDPDAIATAWALCYLAEKRSNVQSSIACGGYIGRAENRAMVQKLKIKLEQVNKIKFKKYDRIALVDTQPGAGNNSLPSDVHCHILIDHHPHRHHASVDLEVIKPDLGVSATILTEWLEAGNIEIPADLATALAYAISSETQNLGRETSSRDIRAYLTVYTRSSIRIFAQIIHPKLPRSYFITLAKALNRTYSFRNLICAHLDDVPNVENVSEMADFLLRHQRIGWSLCTGRFKGQLYISLRSTNPGARAGKLLRKLVPDSNTVGGHDMVAGGFIPMKTGKEEEMIELESKLTSDFAKLMNYQEPDWKPLLPHSSR